MSYKTIIYEPREPHTALLVLNRPKQYNTFDQTMVQELREVLETAKEDEELRVLVLTGREGSFSAGGDVSWLLSAQNEEERARILEMTKELVLTLEGFPKPILAGINGVAAGAGTAIALACDMVIASEQARFAPNFINIGAVPDAGSSWYLLRKLGYHKAMELLLLGDVLDAEKALQLGIFNRVVPDQDLEKEILAVAARLAQGPGQAILDIKHLLKQSSLNGLREQLDLEARYQVRAFGSEDFREGVEAFLNKRRPEFS